jgi:hypothetical protein
MCGCIASLNLDRAVVIVDEINSRGPLACHAVLGAVYERLYRRKGLYLALEVKAFFLELSYFFK